MMGRDLEWCAGCLLKLGPGQNAPSRCMQGTCTVHTYHDSIRLWRVHRVVLPSHHRILVCSQTSKSWDRTESACSDFLFFWFWIHTVSTPITSGTHTDGGAVTKSPETPGSKALPHFRPTQSIMYVPLQVNRFRKIILLIVQYKYLKSCSRRFYCPNLILRTRLCGTMFITQPSCLFYFHLTESVRRKWFVLAVYQFWKGISAGPAIKYFTWFIGAGGILF